MACQKRDALPACAVEVLCTLCVKRQSSGSCRGFVVLIAGRLLPVGAYELLFVFLHLVVDLVGVVHVEQFGGGFLRLWAGEPGLGWVEDARVAGHGGVGLGVWL